jgi:phosphatidylglycerophosphate synthase
VKSGFSALTAEYRSMLKATEVEEVLDLILFRPLAFGLVKAVQPTSITPNQITFVSLIMGLASGYCYWQGTPQYLLWGAILLFLTNLFDCADGMLARVRKSSSLTGYLFDGLVDYTTNTAVIVGMLHGLSVTGASPLFIWLIGVPAGLSYAWWCARVDGVSKQLFDKIKKKTPEPKVEK